MPRTETIRSTRHGSALTGLSGPRRSASRPCDAQLVFGCPIALLVWPQKSDSSSKMSKSRRYYQALGPHPGAWWHCTWNTPLRVRGRGDTILLADSRVNDHKDFEIHAPHMMSSDVPTSSTPRYTFDSLARCTNNSPEDQLLDFDTQITLMVWLKDAEEPLYATVYPHDDRRVRLADNEADLEMVGLQKENVTRLRRYRCQDSVGHWIDCAWDTPLLVSDPGDALILSAPNVTQFKHFSVHEPHLIQL
ncbi:hypothetical protein B0H16DRAFT_1470322 [Mycena metata]|uniref:Uncharacterized protein n=1 Tax=Mycena metata TaxID=1033252 RepID=A0AAD7HVR8_9AGAR|nr:hypothetical protein B0H16DRAFT_1470322 [Mycena metata]